MTIVIWDGKDLLVDRVTTITQSDITGEDGTPQPYYVELDKSKIYLASENKWEAKVWGRAIKAFTMVGDTEHRHCWLNFLETGDDVHSLAETAKNFQHLLTPNAEYILIDEDNVLHVFESTHDMFRSNYYSTPARKPIIFGCAVAVELLNNVFTSAENKLSPLECMVLAQAHYPVLGRRFDHWNAESNILTRDNDLSDRARHWVASRAVKKISVNSKPRPVNIVNR
ncbi:hypothetical protein [Pseudomonas phage vB_PaeM_PS119XW]|uniref:Uncharacterized protein n=1 Tax=Pseudomonas phage vB_PaeM_PS119XW TaxID=2601632 RepID=A0A5C1K7J7_9CAUD|nr:hypothetical protein PP933_gp368 [Pseudomonas phage vB_PaeM_PS119XW]QEM42097.1 hypothetical protein [Pseudomonas phage vB_PaeM_PS119XW]